VAQAAESQGQLRRILPDWRVAPLSLQLTYNSRRNQPMSVRKLIEHLIETLGREHGLCSTTALRLVDEEAPAVDATGRVTKAAARLNRRAVVHERLATA
jgi:hypothetical protein